MERYVGGCLCGDVRFVAEGRPYRVGLCHCLDCRKHHGAPFATFAAAPSSGFRWLTDTGTLTRYASSPNAAKASSVPNNTRVD